jgi:hypothetical protein
MIHGKVPYDLQHPDRSIVMHKPEHLDQLATAARFIAEKMKLRDVLPDHQPGYLVVHNSTYLQVLLSIHVGTYGQFCPAQVATKAKFHNEKVKEHPHNSGDGELQDGTTSSDISPLRAGSVAASNLIIGYASRDGKNHPLHDEAVAIMVAIKAGLLPKSAVKKRYCNQGFEEHNAALRAMINTITWTN